MTHRVNTKHVAQLASVILRPSFGRRISRDADALSAVARSSGRILAVILVLLAGQIDRVYARQDQTQSQSSQNESISERTERRGSQLPIRQTQEEADAKTRGCMSCHTPIDSVTMHSSKTVRIGCTDCHGGDASVMNSAASGSAEYEANKNKAHIRARFREDERSSANPIRANFGARWEKESAEWIKFVNPGDNRISAETCGRAGCHVEEVHQVRTSMMTHGAMLWEAALYNNGGYPMKNARFGESYSRDGKP